MLRDACTCMCMCVVCCVCVCVCVRVCVLSLRHNRICQLLCMTCEVQPKLPGSRMRLIDWNGGEEGS